jgi:uncharacterized membrane protein YoaK (UPF0700 family)
VAVFPGVILPHLLSLTAGFVDAAGFLVLQGLFIAHATGNFVTLGASLVLGTSGAIAKLLALPVFCILIVATRFLSGLLSRHQKPPLPAVRALMLALLVLGGTLANHFGPFGNRGEWDSIVTGMVLVAAMAVQNAAHRIHLVSASPSTLMTGTTTRVMIDLADMLQWFGEGRNGQQAARQGQMLTNLLVFAVGCAAAALLCTRLGCGVSLFRQSSRASPFSSGRSRSASCERLRAAFRLPSIWAGGQVLGAWLASLFLVGGGVIPYWSRRSLSIKLHAASK